MPEKKKRTPLTMSAKEVADELGTTEDKVRAAILNGTMPIGMVAQGDRGERYRVIIVKVRYDKWKAGTLRL